MSVPATCAAPRLVTAKPKSVLPAGACDCHFHIFDEPSQQTAERSYTAPRASLSDYRQLKKTLGIQRAVIVQPSIYGLDNETTLSACKTEADMKSVIVIDNSVSDKTLRDYADAGAVGCRVNLLFASGVHTGSLTDLAQRIADFGLHLQVLADISRLEALESVIPKLPVPIMFDHMGHMPAAMGVQHRAFQLFLKYLADGLLWVKLSGAYRISEKTDGHYDDAAAFAAALVNANPEHLVWGTDWPHPQVSGTMPDDTDLLNHVLDWVPNTHHRQRIFVDNPVSFYGF